MNPLSHVIKMVEKSDILNTSLPEDQQCETES